MPKHYCLDPQDPYAQREVLVDFEPTAVGFRLIAARDADDTDILPELIDAQRADLACELAQLGLYTHARSFNPEATRRQQAL